MRRVPREGFVLSSQDLARDILIPRYYDPRLAEDMEALKHDYHVPQLRELISSGDILHTQGDYVPKIHYGTGPYPYVRTSDLANWEIKASPKHGVPQSVYGEYAPAQSVQPKDILFVHEGTYLIGTVGMVTEYDGPLLFQHHLAKFTVGPSSPFNSYYLLAALESPFVHRQIRAKQFSADIIDSVVGRVEEIYIPYPKDRATLRSIERRVKGAVSGRAKLRAQVAHASEEVDLWLRDERDGSLASLFAWEPDLDAARQPAFLGGRRHFGSAALRQDDVKNNILLPRYYDPWVLETAVKYADRCNLRTFGELVDANIVEIKTGDEIGRLNYGTGNIPFVRTSDFGSWELKREAKQGVSKDVFDVFGASQDVQPGDILLVRDGTYLVGTSVLVNEIDVPLLFCGGIYKIRSKDPEQLPPGLLFALLNIPFVRRQIRNKQFTRDVIDTLGQRVMELILPIPRDDSVREGIDRFFSQALKRRAHLRQKLSEATKDLAQTSKDTLAS